MGAGNSDGARHDPGARDAGADDAVGAVASAAVASAALDPSGDHRMTVAVVALGIALALCALALAGLVFALRDAVADHRAALEAEAEASQHQLEAQAQRDAAVLAAGRSDALAKDATAQLAAAQRDANNARKELAERVKQVMATGSADDGARLLNELLASPVVPAAGPPGDPGSGVGHSTAPAV